MTLNNAPSPPRTHRNLGLLISDILLDGENNLQFTNATIASRGTNYIDVSFSAAAGDFHWVIFDDLSGAYQYFVNRALPDISILRTLWRLAPEYFPNGRTHLKDEPLPDFSLYANATKVQDETWQLADGSFITKYDWSNAVRDRDFNGIYGSEAGSWYIHPTTEYYNSDHLSQTLTVSARVICCVKIVCSDIAADPQRVKDWRLGAAECCSGHFALSCWTDRRSAGGQGLGPLALVSGEACRTYGSTITLLTQ